MSLASDSIPPAKVHRPLRSSNDAFEASELAVRAENCRRAIQTGILFIPLGIVTDLWIYPESVFLFATVRILCTILVGLFLIPLRNPGPKGIIFLNHLAILIPTTMVLWLIAYSGDPLCPYREGLSLIMVIAAMIIRWRFIDSLSHALFVLVSYSLIYFNLGGTTGGYLTTIYFLLGFAGFSILSCYLYNNLRHREHYLKEEVEANRLELLENNEKLQALAEVKDRFFANVSHELRTPLTLILGPIEQLSSNPCLQENPKAKAHIDTLSTNGFRLLRLINELLAVARLETGDLPDRLENIHLQEFSERIRRSLAAIATSKNIAFSVHAETMRNPVRVLDTDRLEKIITNLCINALKFTPSGGLVDLTFLELPDDTLTIVVTDNGIGLSQEELPHIFERFWQANASTSRKSRGAGIGLALAKSLAESMGGQLTVTSSIGKGTTFTLTIPALPENPDLPTFSPFLDIDRANDDPFDELHGQTLVHAILDGPFSTSDTQSSSPAPSRKKSSILIVDDEASMRSYLTTFLDNHRVLTAANGEDGLALARREIPDLILLDYMMPGIDGIEVAHRLRKEPTTSRIPILLITAHGGDAPRISALEAGVNDFLTKPFYSSEIIARIQNLLLNQKYESDLKNSNDDLNRALIQLQEKEEELVRSEKLSSLGQMSAGIVHEINNPLNYAKTSLHILKDFKSHLPEDQRDDYDETLGDLADGLQRVIRIITDLRALTRVSAILKFPTPLSQITQNAVRLLSHELVDVHFTVDVPEDLEVLGNENQLCQVFVNLIQNALHATAGVTEPTITLRATKAPENFTLITISDNGHGIPDEVRSKIFDPFFTTKDIGIGTGLGLSLTFKIIEDHHGSLSVISAQNEGATFRILLPSSPPQDS